MGSQRVRHDWATDTFTSYIKDSVAFWKEEIPLSDKLNVPRFSIWAIIKRRQVWHSADMGAHTTWGRMEPWLPLPEQTLDNSHNLARAQYTHTVKVVQSCPALCDPMDYIVQEILQARILERVSLSLLQGIFPSQGSNPGLLHCRQILYHLSHQRSPYFCLFLNSPSVSAPGCWINSTL